VRAVTKKKISEAQKRKWESGTRKPNPEGYGEKISQKLKQAHAEGRMHVITHEAAMKGLAARDMNKVIEALKRSAKARIGVPMPPGPSAKGVDHHKARYWIIQNVALGVTLEGLNLNELVRENSMLFNETDLNWNGGYVCRATKGIRNLFGIRKSTGRPSALSWKGWMPVDVKSREPSYQESRG